MNLFSNNAVTARSRDFLCALALFASIILTCRVAFAQQGYEVIDVGTLGGDYSEIVSISPSGEWACGTATDANGVGHAVRFHVPTRSLVDLGLYNNYQTVGVAVNNSGMVLARVRGPEGPNRAARIAVGGSFQLLPLPSQPGITPESSGNAINQQGDVIGTYLRDLIVLDYSACVWLGTTHVPLVGGGWGTAWGSAISDRVPAGDPNALPWVVFERNYAGISTWIAKPTGPYPEGTQFGFPGNNYARITDVNNAGDCIGYPTIQGSGYYRYRDGTFVSLGDGLYRAIRKMAENGNILMGLKIYRVDNLAGTDIFTQTSTYESVTSSSLGSYYRFNLVDISENNLVVGIASPMVPGTPTRGVIVRCSLPSYDSLTITPSTLRTAPGIQRRLTATATSGGVSTDVSALVMWSSDNPSVATASYHAEYVPALAVLEGVAAGSATIHAELNGLIAGATVVCEPLIGASNISSLAAEAGLAVPLAGRVRNTNASIQLTPDGRYVTVLTNANNLGPVDTRAPNDALAPDGYRIDRTAHTATRVTVTSGGQEPTEATYFPVFSAVTPSGPASFFTYFRSDLWNGTDTNAVNDVFVSETGTPITCLSTGPAADTSANGAAELYGVSDSGRYVAYRTYATNISGIAGNATSGVLIVLDRQTGQRLPLGTAGASAQFTGTNERLVLFTTTDSLLPSDTNTTSDLYMRDLDSGYIEVINCQPNGLTSDGSSGYYYRSISDDAQIVAFTSSATNIVPGVTGGLPQIYLRDRTRGSTTLISRGLGGEPGNGTCGSSTITADGNVVYFRSEASNLVPGDTNGVSDIFRYIRSTHQMELLSVNAAGQQGDGASLASIPSDDGSVLAYRTAATNLIPNSFASPIFGTYTDHGVVQVLAVPCGRADIGMQPGILGYDAALDNNDFIVFINLFFTSDDRADFGSQGGVAGPDGFFDNDDFIVFIDQFFAGC